MKIAIMTQPLGKNYGGMIQAWALQQVLKKAGHEPVTMDRQADAKGPAYHAARLGKRAVKKALGKWNAPINFERHLPEILQHPRAFIDQHLSMSEPLDSTEKLKAHFNREQYDAVIVGSDQTWRPRYSPNIGNFFLDFLQDSDIKRIAYASSFGVDEWEFSEEQTRRCAAYAKQFDAVGMREKSGVELCQKHLEIEATQTLDPTLLLQKEYYEALYSNKDIQARQGIYTYILDQAPWKEQVVETVKQILNKPLYSNQSKTSISSLASSNARDYTMPSIEGWLKGFQDAEFVITDSFHGTVFSILYNKSFIALGNKKRGMSRFTSLLQMFGLESRLLLDGTEQNTSELMDQKIDWACVNVVLEAERAKALSFLKASLE